MQRKLLLCFVLVLLVATVHAQIKKGTVLLGGQIGFAAQKYSPSTANGNSFFVSPVFGKAVKDNLVAGVSASYSQRHYDYNPGSYDFHSYGLGFFLRQYKELGKGFYLFGEAGAGGNYYKDKQVLPSPSTTDVTNHVTSIRLSLYPGVAYAATRRLHIEAGFSNLALFEYSHTRQEVPANADQTGSSFSFTSSLSSNAGFTFGFRVLL